MSTIAHI